jgi:hypothetical protein
MIHKRGTKPTQANGQISNLAQAKKSKQPLKIDAEKCVIQYFILAMWVAHLPSIRQLAGFQTGGIEV